MEDAGVQLLLSFPFSLDLNEREWDGATQGAGPPSSAGPSQTSPQVHLLGN